MSAPASTQAQQRSIADCMPSTASASVRAIITKSSSHLASTAALMRSTISCLADEGFARAMTAAFLRHLVLNMHGRCAGFDHGLDGPGDTQCAAPAGVDVDQHREGR